MRPCRKCGASDRDKRGKCIPCKKNRDRDWYQAHKDKAAGWRRAWYLATKAPAPSLWCGHGRRALSQAPPCKCYRGFRCPLQEDLRLHKFRGNRSDHHGHWSDSTKSNVRLCGFKGIPARKCPRHASQRPLKRILLNAHQKIKEENHDIKTGKT